MMAMQQSQPLRGELLEYEPMSRHTTWRVGGPARRYYRPADIEDLALFLRQLPEGEALYWLGLGSNLLVRDGGIDGTVIATSGRLNVIERLAEHQVRVECGVSCAKVARFCAREGLAGAEFLCGIPGTLGGALAMNAGCFGGETWQLVEKVETLDLHGNVKFRHPEEYRIGYRHVRGPVGEWFVAAHLKLVAGDSEQLQSRIRGLLEQRSSSQPTQLPNAGSVFRNPEGDYAARLIEAAGLKGQCIGGACVSDKHANFIVNTGTATARDIEMLIERVQTQVEDAHGIHLQREVHIIGEAKGGAS
ncbi:MAG TPA: UDP-N-acetylmuramate dehydrogenase [Gammaproteobacteria bacterium]